MSIISSVGNALGDQGNLILKLRALADDAGRAAGLAEGEYLPQMSRAAELQTAEHTAAQAASLLGDLTPRIAVLDGGEDGLRLAQSAIGQLDEGRLLLRDGGVIGDDLTFAGPAVRDAITTSSASAKFRDAADAVRGIADIATFEATSVDDMLAAITRPLG